MGWECSSDEGTKYSYRIFIDRCPDEIHLADVGNNIRKTKLLHQK
jgi:hypothetical protein